MNVSSNSSAAGDKVGLYPSDWAVIEACVHEASRFYLVGRARSGLGFFPHPRHTTTVVYVK